jgi:hypothetical protein
MTFPKYIVPYYDFVKFSESLRSFGDYSNEYLIDHRLSQGTGAWQLGEWRQIISRDPSVEVVKHSKPH